MRGLSYPFFLQWHLTEKCNLSCRHCYQKSPVDEMRYEEIRQAIDEVADTLQFWTSHYDMDVSPAIHFTGGEPLLRDDVFGLLRHARWRGFSPSLLSNGTLITRDIARELKAVDIKDVQVSLDGMEVVHDDIRGKGAFRKAITGCRNLVAEGIDLDINMTVSRLNYGELHPLVQLAGTLGASAVGFSRLVPCGRGSDFYQDLLSPELLSSLGRILTEYDENGGSVTVVSRDPLISMMNIIDYEDIAGLDFPVGGCSAGLFGITITADGTIMPCRRMDLPIGNIMVDDFRKLWMESPVLTALRDRQCYHGNCHICCYWAVCRGCRAIALADARSNGKEDYLGPDPQCSYCRPVNKLCGDMSYG